MCLLFLNQFPPWEVEEMAYIRDYIRGRSALLFAKHGHEIVQQTSQGAPEDSAGDHLPFEGSTIGHVLIPTRLISSPKVMLEPYEERCMSRGLDILRRISQASAFDQVSMLVQNLIHTHPLITRTLENEPYD